MSDRTTLIQQLESWGPGRLSSPVSRDQAWSHVRTLTTSHYENFSVLSRLVPAKLREDFAAVYAFCRWSDDLGDETGAGEEARARSLELLDWWRGGLRDIADGTDEHEASRHPVYVALRETMGRRELSPEPFHHLIDAFEQDQRVTEYSTWDALMGYCENSADPVGRIVLALSGIGDGADGPADLYAMSDATCSALQLTNFWQDVRRDLDERSRIYLPVRETGITREMLTDWSRRPDDPSARVPYIRAVRPLVDRTRALFLKGRPLPEEMGNALSRVVWLFGAGGESVLRAVERGGCATLWSRPRLSKPSKAILVARASMRRYPQKR